jgi:ATP-dependent protease ClpP protease subunit
MPKMIDISINNIIGGAGTTSALLQSQLADKTIENIMLTINSPGGSVFEGMSMYNMLKDHPAKVHGKVTGLCASIASVVLMGCDTIEMTKNSMLMIHMPKIDMTGSASDLRKNAEILDRIKENIIACYKSKLKKSVDIENMMEKETWLTPEDAYEMGFCDIISDTAPIKTFFDLSKLNYTVPESVYNQYDVSGQEEIQIKPVKESDVYRLIRNIKNIFNLKKEPEMAEKKIELSEGSDESKIAELTQTNAALAAEIAELKKTVAALQQKQVTAEAAVRTAEYTAFLDSMVTAGKIVPADVPTHKDILETLHTDAAKLESYKALLSKGTIQVALDKHVAVKDKAAVVLEPEAALQAKANEIYENAYKAGRRITLSDAIREAHKCSAVERS